MPDGESSNVQCTHCVELRRQLEALTGTYQGLKAGDVITVQWTQNATIPNATVVETCEFGALVQCFKPDGVKTFDMYVRHQNEHGNWYR